MKLNLADTVSSGINFLPELVFLELFLRVEDFKRKSTILLHGKVWRITVDRE
jgi:hypothetical protein